MKDRMRQLEQDIIAGVANASAAGNDNDGVNSELTDNLSTVNSIAQTGSASSYLRQRLNTHNSGGACNNSMWREIVAMVSHENKGFYFLMKVFVIYIKIIIKSLIAIILRSTPSLRTYKLSGIKVGNFETSGFQNPTEMSEIFQYGIFAIRKFYVPVNPIIDISVRQISDVNLANDTTRIGFDSHADISCIGGGGRLLRVHDGKVCQVMPFNDGYKPLKDVRIIDTAFKYILDTDEPIIIVINQALDFRDSMTNFFTCDKNQFQ
jgi:hypothetical protein